MADKESLCAEKVFERFYREHVSSLRNHVYYKYGDAEQADDVTQEAFVRIWNKCAEIAMHTAKAYLFKIANNLSISLKRSEQVELKYRERAVRADEDLESPEFVILEKEYMDRLTDAIGRLPDKQREAFLLNRIEKKKYREIAEMMEVSVKAIEKLMHKALIKLRKEIGDV